MISFKVKASIFINAPTKDVFDFIAEPNNLPMWRTGARKTEKRSEGAVGYGTTFTVGGVSWKLVEYDRPSSLLWESETPVYFLVLPLFTVKGHGGYKFEPKDKGTLVTFSDEALFTGLIGMIVGILMKICFPLYFYIKLLMTMRLRWDLKKLKRVIESGQARSA